MKRLLWIVQAILVVLVTLPIALLPFRLALRAGDGLGLLLFHVWGSRRRIAIDNLSAAVERGALTLTVSAEETIRRHFRNLGRSFVEVLKIYYGLGDHIVRSVRTEGSEHYTAAAAEGRGIICITGHCGNWEVMALAFGTLFSKPKVVARRINNPYFNWLVERTRSRFGNGVIYKQGALRQILGALHRNEVVGILMDQSVVSTEGVVAEFLGKKDYTMKTPAVIAMKTGASVLPVLIRREGGGHVMKIHPPVDLQRTGDADADVLANTVRFSGFIEDHIRQYPEEWLWIHRRWKRL